MSEHARHTAERHCDVAVVGGSAAGLAAALQLARQHRSVVVIDSGEPRNAPAAHMHGYLGHEGLPPADLTAIGREEVRGYGVEVLRGRVVGVTRADDGRFAVELAAGHRLVARRVLAATGLVDELPAIEGAAEHWGGDVIHCPFCHGYEARDRRIVQIVTHPVGLHPAGLFRQLSDRLTLVLHAEVEPDHPDLEKLRAAGVDVVAGPVERVVSGDDGRVEAVELAGGRRLEADVVVVSARFRARVEAFAPLGLEVAPHPTGMGDFVEVDANGETSVPGLYAAGNVTDPGQQVLHAAAAGSMVGAKISFSLAHEDIEAAARPAPAEASWDERYSGEQMWSGNPNGTLVGEVEGLVAGRVLDVGAGEGGDAIWLAQQGWTVTASDISQRALDRVATAAAAQGLSVATHRADADALDPFEAGAFDLVSAQYVPIPRSPDGRGIANLLAAVAPGGTLLVVGHDPAPMRAPQGEGGHHPFIDPDAFVRPEDIAAVLAATPGWEVEVHEKRPRPGGHSTPHVDDVVLRARRTG